MNKCPYIPFQKFVFRTPLYPLQYRDKWMQYYCKPEFKEALFLASPEFAECNLLDQNEKKVAKQKITLYKYFSRACTRSTPFGLFAGCSIGSIGEKTSIELVAQEKYKRVTRLDMQYLCSLIKHIEQDENIRPLLLFFPNDSMYEIGGKLRYIEYQYRKTSRIHKISAVQITKYVTTIISKAQNGAKRKELASSITVGEISYEEAIEFVDEIIDAQLLKSKLDPSIVGEDVLTVLINKLALINDTIYLPILSEIKGKLDEIDMRPIGEATNLYEEIIHRIKLIGVEYDIKYLFQSDMFKPVSTATISNDVFNDIKETLLFLSAISTKNINENLKAFKEAFSKRYEGRTMALAEVLDTELGLGYPYKATGSSDVDPLIDDLIIPYKERMSNNQVFFTQSDAVLLRKYVECIKRGEDTIVLTDADFKLDFATNFIPQEDLTDTLSIMFSLIEDSSDKRTIWIKSINNICGAALLGRFCHLNPELKNLVKSIADREKELNPNVIIAEISHLPESRIGNIASRPLFRDFVIHYLSNSELREEQNISLSDLMISVKGDKLVLSRKKDGKEIYPRLTCAHNYSLSPIPFYRLLCDLQSQQASKSINFSYGSIFLSFNYLPRIKYKNTILVRQKWVIKQEEIKGAYELKDLELVSFFKILMHNRNICQHVVVAQGDNDMYIDLQNVHSLYTLLDIVKKREIFIIEEFLFDNNSSIIKDQHGFFTNEIIAIFHRPSTV